MKAMSKTREQTRKNFIDAFLRIYPDTPIEKIGIRQITDEAGYNRSSFYLYFTDIYDLAGTAEENFLARLGAEIEEHIARARVSSLREFPDSISSLSERYAEMFYAFRDSKSFRTKFTAMFEPLFCRINGLDPQDRYTGFLVSLAINSLLHNIEYWYEHRDTFTLGELLDIMKQLLAGGITSAGKRGSCEKYSKSEQTVV